MNNRELRMMFVILPIILLLMLSNALIAKPLGNPGTPTPLAGGLLTLGAAGMYLYYRKMKKND